jgi:hypothetical protein
MFIDDLNVKKILNLKKKYNVIFRNYQKNVTLEAIINFNKICKAK